MAYLDLQIGWGPGGGGGWSSRPRDKGLKEIVFRLLGPHFGLKIRGGGPSRPLSWNRHCVVTLRVGRALSIQFGEQSCSVV